MRGLLAIEPLYHQIVKGAKTQTRRSGCLEEVNVNPDNWEITGYTGEENQLEEVDFCDYMDTQRNIHCKPRYKVGEVLYLKEPITIISGGVSEKEFLLYKYNTAEIDRCNFKWSNKLFMPQADARAFVKITGIRCERLLDISYTDAISEGVQSMGYHGWKDYLKPNTFELTAIESFLSLYKFANKVKTIDNIWVWVYEFQYIKDYKI
jgi:hypothetical protein